jgi:hypothetical protein
MKSLLSPLALIMILVAAGPLHAQHSTTGPTAKATTHTRAALQPIGWNDFVAVMTAQSFEPRMVCTKCGTIGADVRPNWRERTR